MPQPAEPRLAFTRTGSGQVVVFLHPIGLNATFWAPVIAALEGEVTACAIDLPGHGGSDAEHQPATIENLAASLAHFMREERLAPAIVVGCSLGGMIAQALAARHPDLVRGLVLANTNFAQTDAGRAAMRARASLARSGMDKVVSPWLERWFSDKLRATNPALVASISEMLLAADAETHAQCWEAIGDLDLTDALPLIAVPSLVVAGGDDQSIPLGKSQALAAALPDGELTVVTGAGHLTPYERPAEFAGLVLNFARSLAAR